MAILKIKLDLDKLLKQAEPDRRKRVAFTPYINSDAAKREFGKLCIDKILERTNSGKDKDGEGFTGYSTAYKKSLKFKIYDKTNKVNLKLTGQMQSDIDVIKVEATSVTIGFVNREEELKALGHINGANDLPIRNFWGISQEEQYEIFKGVIKDIASEIDTAELIDEEGRTFTPLNSTGTEFDVEEN